MWTVRLIDDLDFKMVTIEKIKIFNFKKNREYSFSPLPDRNLLIGDNEVGKSSILQAVNLVLSGSRNRIETIGLESLFNVDAINEFQLGAKTLDKLPKLIIEVYLIGVEKERLWGENNTDEKGAYGLKLVCEPMIEEWGEEIKAFLADQDSLFPFEFYSISFQTFAAHLYNQNQKYINHILLDSSNIGSEYAMNQYTKSVYMANSELVERKRISHAYRASKSKFTNEALQELNSRLGEINFSIKNDQKSNLEKDLEILEKGISLSLMGKGKQCFIKTEFALERKSGSTPLDLVLLEEPENHLSAVNMKKLIEVIENATSTQTIIATHNNQVASRLDLKNAFLLDGESNKPVTLHEIPTDTAAYFIKAPNTKILEFCLSKKVILVEGDAEFMLIESMYTNAYEEKLEMKGISVISVGGTSFKRYLDLAKFLKIKVAVIRDNDGDYQNNCVDNYKEYSDLEIEIFSDEDENTRTTFELCIYKDNQAICEELFSKGRRTLSVQEYMLKNKADASFELLNKKADELVSPGYIKRAFTWIRE